MIPALLAHIDLLGLEWGIFKEFFIGQIIIDAHFGLLQDLTAP
jgi:hypothetical protein